jgi:hypothetical protein
MAANSNEAKLLVVEMNIKNWELVGIQVATTIIV